MEEQDISIIFNKAYVRTLRFLSYRARSEKEIKDYLLKKKYENLIIEKVIELLKKQNLINDEEFTKWWIEQRQTYKIKSQMFIKRELKMKGIPQETIEKFLSVSQDDYHSALTVFEKNKHKFQKYKGLDYLKKASSFLQRRGFNWEIINKILNKSNL